MPKHKVVIGAKSFSSKKAAKEHFRSILSSSEIGSTIVDDAKEDLMHLIMRHPESTQKIGKGVKRFFAGRGDYGTTCFYLERVDGSTTDFSFNAAVDQKEPTLHQRFSQACREAVGPELRAAKLKFFDENQNEDKRVPCEITGRLIVLRQAHLDHKPPMTFQVIVQTFIASLGGCIEDSWISPPSDNEFVARFSDQVIQKKFVEFHHSLVRDTHSLRIIAKEENIALGSRHRIRKPQNFVPV